MTEELIKKFFNKLCTAPEASEVSQYLKDNPAVLEKYVSSKDWTGTGSQQMPDEFWNDNWAAIQARKSSVGKITWIRRTAVAAVLVISAGFLYWNFFIGEKSKFLAASEKPIVKRGRKINVNNSDQVVNLHLPDSSEVMLSPGSLISYNTLFSGNKRDIILDGEGRFKVMKDQQKPFTVYAGGLAISALGTEFTISTRGPVKNSVSVKLHDGRVMIKATGEMLQHWKKTIYLEPGQQLHYDTMKMIAEVDLFKSRKITVKTMAVKKPKKVSPESAPGLDFVNTSLPEVMNRLSGYYHEKITFDSITLNEMNFTGAISQNDSLHLVLKVIAQMNDLQLYHDGKGYELKRTVK